MMRLTHLVAVAALAMASPAMAHGHPGPWFHHADTVVSVTPSTLTVKDGTATEEIPMSALTVRAGMYPAHASILRAGEQVTVLKRISAAPLVIVHPAAHGILAEKSGSWQLTSKHHTWTLKGTPVLLGLDHLTAGTKALAFGPARQQQVAVTAVAARPLMTRATVTASSSRSLSAKSDQYGTLTYSLTDLPEHLQAHLAATKPGETVVVCLNPQNRQVLMMMPDRMAHWVTTLEHGTAGQVVAVSAKDLTLTNSLGTVTIPLNQQTSVRWPDHPHTTVKAVRPGMRIIAVRHSDASLRIMVLHR